MQPQKLPIHLLTLEDIINPNPLIVEPNTSLTEVIEQMSQIRGSNCGLFADSQDIYRLTREYRRSSYVLVMAEKRLLGIFTEQDLVKLAAAQIDCSQTPIAQVMTKSVITLERSQAQDIFQILSCFRQYHIRHLPIVNQQQQVLGVTTLDSIRQALQPYNFLKLRTTTEVMKKDVIVASTNTSILQLAQLMSEHHVSCVVIILERKWEETQSQTPVGIVTERDMVQFQVLGLNFATTEAKMVMSTPLFPLKQEDSLWYAHQLMQRHRVQRLVVTGERGELVGIVTQTTLLQVLDPLKMWGDMEQLQDILTAQTEELRTVNQQLQAEITQRQSLENQLREAKTILEKQVGLATAQLIQTNTTLQAEIAEHRKAEQELERFFAITPTMLCVAGFDGYFKRLNSAFTHILGFSEKQLLAQPFLNLIHPDDQQATITEVEKLSQGETTIAFENRYLCQDGSYRWLLWTATPYLEEKLIYAAARDITHRKNSELELKQERDFIAAVVNTVGALVAVLDRQGKIFSFNRTCEEVTGYSLAEVKGKQMWDFLLVSEEETAVKAVFSQLISGQVPNQYENYWLTKEGYLRRIAWSNTALYDAKGEVQYIIATGIDITETQQAQEKLHRQHKQAQLLAEVTRKIRQSLRLEEILHTTVAEVQQLLTCDRVLIVQIHPDGKAIPVSEAVLQQLPSMLGQELTDPLLYGAYQEDYRQGRILSISDLAQVTTQPQTKAFLQQFAVQAKLIVPILEKKQLWGLLIVHQCHDTRKWQNWEIELLQQLSDQISIAISQAQLLNNQEQLVAERTSQLIKANRQLQREINDRQLAQIALTESQQTLAGILDTADEGIISIDQAQKIIIFNQGAERIFGYTPEEILGQSLDILLPEAFRQIHRQHIQNFGNSEEKSRKMVQRSGTVFGRRRSGEEFPAEASISKLHSRDGAIFTVMLKDITERQQAEQALRRSEKQLRLLTNALPVLIAYIDAQQRYRFNNQAHENWFENVCEQINGCYIWEIIGAVAYHQIQNHIQAVFSRQSVSFEVELPYQNNSSRWVSASFIPDCEPLGEVKGFFALFSDISEHKAIERVKSEFVSVVSHELRTPLTSIHGVLQLLDAGRLDKLSETTQEMVAIALRNTDRLVRLINDVLDLERMESGRESMAQRSCDGIELIQQAVDTMQTMAQQHGVSLYVSIGKEKVETPLNHPPIMLWADSDHILQTLTNLISNAIKFSPQESQVWVSLEEQESQLLFAVKDQGRGIPAEKLETVFERFQQVDASDSRQKGGTGLGLAICRHIVEKHHGKIWVESTLNEGSTFYFTLPTVDFLQKSSNK